MQFQPKLNKRVDGTAHIVQERLKLIAGKYEGALAHDNIATSSVRVYTGAGYTGEEIVNFTISIPADAPWRRSIRVFADVAEVFVSYQTPGDQVDAEDINLLQDSLTETRTTLKNELDETRTALQDDLLETRTTLQNDLDGTKTALQDYQDANNLLVNDARARLSAVELGKAEKTFVDSQLLLKADKSQTYTKSETDNRISEIVGAAPEALDTLQELADALDNDPNFAGTMTTKLASKVDKEQGKGLSESNYTPAEKSKLAGIAAGAQANSVLSVAGRTGEVVLSAGDIVSGTLSPARLPSASGTAQGAMSAADKVKLDGIAEGAQVNPGAASASAAGLMSAADKAKLDGVAAGANNYTHPATHPPSVIVQDASNRFMTDAERTKLAGIAAGAQVNPAIATQAQAEAGADNVTTMTPLRTAQAIADKLSDFGGGDMLKSVYDTNNDGKVNRADTADSVPWAGVSGKPTTYAPSGHTHDDRYTRITSLLGNGIDLNTIVTSGFYRMSGSHPNAPNGADWSQLIVSRGNDTIAQIIVTYGQKKTYIRSGNPSDVGGTGSWGIWYEVAYTSNVMPKGPLTWAQLRGDA